MTHTGKIYALVETGSDVSIIHNNYNESNLIWVAVSPLCIPQLKEKGIPFHSIYKFFPASNLFEEINPQSENIRQDIIRITDEWARAQFHLFKENNLYLLKYFESNLINLFDNLCLKLYCLDRFISEAKPEEIVVRKVITKYKSDSNLLNPWDWDETVWSLCAEFLVKEKYKNIRITKFTEMIKIEANKKGLFLEVLNSRFPRFFNFLQSVKREGLKGGYLFYRNKSILVLDQNQWKLTRTLFAHAGYKFVNYPIRNHYRSRKIITNYFKEIGLEPICNIRGINFSELVENHINQYIQYGISSFPQIYQTFKILLSKIQPKAVFFSYSDNPEKWLFLQQARQLNIPVFGWGHGASGQSHYTKQYRYELTFCDYYFTQGQGSQETYSQYSEFRFSPIPIGLPQLDKFKDKISQSNDLEEIYDFIFVPTNFYKNTFYFSFYPGLIDFSVYLGQRSIVNYLKTFSDNSVLKISTGNLFKGFFHTSFGKQINIVDNIELTELISKGRAFIIDAPATALLEVLCTQKPVFVLTQFLKLCNEAETLLRKRAICCPNVELLIKELTAYAESGLYKADVTNQEYLSSYGTFLNDGKSAERGVETVIEIISGKTPVILPNGK